MVKTSEIVTWVVLAIIVLLFLNVLQNNTNASSSISSTSVVTTGVVTTELAEEEQQQQKTAMSLMDRDESVANQDKLKYYYMDDNRSFGQVNPRDYIVDDEQGQTRIFRYNKEVIKGLDGQVMASNGQTILAFPSTRQLIGHQYQPWDYEEQYSHPCNCYPRKRALDIIGSNTELPRVCNLCKCPK